MISKLQILRKNRNKEIHYAFDFAFDKFADQYKIYNKTVEYLIEGLLEGFNATIFTYGQTGAGKTYTLIINSNI